MQNHQKLPTCRAMYSVMHNFNGLWSAPQSQVQDLEVMAEDTLCEEATIQIDIRDEAIPDFDWLDVIDQRSKLTQSCEQLSTLQRFPLIVHIN